MQDKEGAGDAGAQKSNQQATKESNKTQKTSQLGHALQNSEGRIERREQDTQVTYEKGQGTDQGLCHIAPRKVVENHAE